MIILYFHLQPQYKYELFQIERFSIECRKTKTKPITYQLDLTQPISNRSKTKTKVIV